MLLAVRRLVTSPILRTSTVGIAWHQILFDLTRVIDLLFFPPFLFLFPQCVMGLMAFQHANPLSHLPSLQIATQVHHHLGRFLVQLYIHTAGLNQFELLSGIKVLGRTAVPSHILVVQAGGLRQKGLREAHEGAIDREEGYAVDRIACCSRGRIKCSDARRH